MEKILVTGANGYIGGCIYNEFSQNKTILVDKLQGRLSEIKPNSLKYDIVIHCAGALRNRKGQHINANVNGTSNLILGLEKTTKIIYISSKSIYGTRLEGCFSEDKYPHPDDEYGISKYEGEKIVINSGLQYIILRSSTVFGLGDKNLGPSFSSIAMQQLFKGNDINVFNQNEIQEYIYVQDLFTIIIKLISLPTSWNNVFNVSGPKRSINQIILSIENCLKTSFVNIGNVIKNENKPNKIFYLNSSKLEDHIGKDIHTSLDVIIKRMSEFLKRKYP